MANLFTAKKRSPANDLPRSFKEEQIFEALGDFTSKDNWDKFFTLRGSGDSFEWYAEWTSLRDPVLAQLSSAAACEASGDRGGGGAPETLRILVPGCGSSRLSEYVYDSGFRSVTNIDFSKVAISDMLRRYLRTRPEMKWRVMDVTEMQFTDEFFDVILDKGSLDALMEPEHGIKLGNKYLKEVKRVLKTGGKYLCITLAESHVIELLLSEFRFGWETSIHAISQGASGNSAFQTFMVVIRKEGLEAVKPVISSFDHSALDCKEKQIQALINIVQEENQTRTEYSSGADIVYSLEDLQLGAKGNLKELQPGRRCKLVLGEQGESLYTYRSMLLDAKQQLTPFSYHCGVFIVPKVRAHEWLFASEEGQWLVVESSKAARLIMVFLDSRHSHSNMDNIQKDLSPLVKGLAPAEDDDGAAIPYMMANDGVKERNIVHQVTSTITGPIIVEDVIYENAESEKTILVPSEVKLFRRLKFERSLGLVQSEALLTVEESNYSLNEKENKKSESSKSRKKGSRKRTDSRMSINGSKSNLKVDHSCLASSYHSGIVSGFSLIASSLRRMASSKEMVRTIVIGLGAGLLPTFIHGCFHFLDIEVVELDPLILDLARDYFGFTEDHHLKVHIGDGIKYIQDACLATKKGKDNSNGNPLAMDGKDLVPPVYGNDSMGIRILIVDADSSDLSSGLTCPPLDFVEESFLLSVKEFLSNGGLFVINLVSRSPAIREAVVSKMKVVFNRLFSLELEEDVNEVLFACTMDVCSEGDHLLDAIAQLRSLLKIPLSDSLLDLHKLKCLK